MALEPNTNKLKEKAGITTISPYQIIDKRQWRTHLTTITEACHEEHAEKTFVRFRFTTYKGSGKAGKATKAFAWPIENIENPQELKSITEKIINACSSSAIVKDNRNFFIRGIDALFGSQFINEIEEIDKHHHFNKLHRLSATIYQEKVETIITLYHNVEKGQHISVILPRETIEAIHNWANTTIEKHTNN